MANNLPVQNPDPVGGVVEASSVAAALQMIHPFVALEMEAGIKQKTLFLLICAQFLNATKPQILFWKYEHSRTSFGRSHHWSVHLSVGTSIYCQKFGVMSH